ncbi:MAG: TonB-dependent receptor plug domain-containing protein, partial [Rhodothermia bacterium]
SGTFNAEYGRAMSGVINVVTRDGGEKLGGSLTLFGGDYASNKSDEFPNIDSFNPLALSNVQFSLNGPVPGSKKKLRFFATGRLFNDDGYIFATRMFKPTDFTDFSADDTTQWNIQATGDGAVVSMNPTRRATGHAKLSYNVTPGLKLSATALYNNLESRDWSAESDEFAPENEFHDFHRYRLNPDGASTQRQKGLNLIATVDHLISTKTFYTLNVSLLANNATSFVYEDPFDSRYTDPNLLRNVSDNAFYSGGTDPWHSDRTTATAGFKGDVTSQVNEVHQLRGGAELRLLTIEFEEFKIIPKKDASGIQIRPFEPALPPRESPFNNAYAKKPREFAVYVQDKIELDNLIANIGLRLDVFDPNSDTPSDYSDPANPALLVDATVKKLISPRIGLAFPITETGVLHFAYGYFFQMPLMKYLYANSEREVEIGRLKTLIGNPDLEPVRTAQYEVGLQQQLSSNVAFEFTAYYKDIRDLIGTEIKQLSTGLDRYATYVNRDFATVRGFVFALTERQSRWMSATIDYTFQIAEGNASEANAAFLDAQANRESEKQLLPLDWDQRHTINLTVNVTPSLASNISMVGKYGSGLPYTPEFLNIRQAFENTARSPSTLTFDLRANYEFVLGTTRFSLFTTIFNLFDQQNEIIVFQDTGRSGFTIQSQLTGRVRGVNTIDEFFSRPDYWSAPRQIRIGTTIIF